MTLTRPGAEFIEVFLQNSIPRWKSNIMVDRQRLLEARNSRTCDYSSFLCSARFFPQITIPTRIHHCPHAPHREFYRNYENLVQVEIVSLRAVLRCAKM